MHRFLMLLFLVLMGQGLQAQTQRERKVSFVGGARSSMTDNRMSVSDTTLVNDTTTALRNQGGYALIDLGIRIMPNTQTEILGMFRIRNGFGGFWGSGVSFDVRQLYVKGIIAHAIRYQLGDINLKQTPFTLFNHHADAIDSLPAVFALQQEVVRYEKFYTQNTWRMQGAHVDGGLTFAKAIRELNFDGFLARMNATNFTSVPDRLMGGASLELVQSKSLKFRYTVNRVFDVKGTIPDSNLFQNTIHALQGSYRNVVKGMPYQLSVETGKSVYRYTHDSLSPNLSDYYVHANAHVNIPRYHLRFGMGYLNVGPNYRSIGAQSKDIQYEAVPNYYDRFTNAQIQRPIGLMDVVSNEAMYQRTINSKLASSNLIYNNAMPYGIATFNRAGLYANMQYDDGMKASVSYYRLNEIVGQGTSALRHFSVIKAHANMPLHTWFNFKKKLELQLGMQWQDVKRQSLYDVENVDFNSRHAQIGLSYEVYKQIELMGAWMFNSTRGFDFSAERNQYTEVTYFNRHDFNLNQRMVAFGTRYNFTPAIYLALFYQQQQYKPQNNTEASYRIGQFNILYNMLF